MKHLVLHTSILLLMALSSLHANAQDNKTSLDEFTDQQFEELLSAVCVLHNKGAGTYYQGKGVEADFEDLLGIDPVVIVVHHNKVDLILSLSKEKPARLSFSRVTGVWSPKNTLWTISLVAGDQVKPKVLWSKNRGMSDQEYFRDQLYQKYLQSTKEDQRGADQSPSVPKGR